MTNLDTALYNAYEAMGPSADAEARVLSALREEAKSGATDPVSGPSEATNRTVHKRWLIVLPFAACLALGAIGLSTLAPTPHTAMQVTDATDAVKANDLESLAEEAEVAEMAESAANEAGAPASNLSPAFSVVTLPTGEVLDVGEPYEGAVDDTNAIEATATTADGTGVTACEVVRARWVRFEGDPTWYTCTPHATQ
ncbi:MAG: hypothetical protein IKG22_03120 [Atopobiaceae bacterium]|nr:hypothetical protein [Atopobiaceae bacterium]